MRFPSIRNRASQGTTERSPPAAGPRCASDAFRPTLRPVIRRLARPALDREVVDVAAAASVLVEQLVVEHVQRDVDLRAAQFWPAFVSTISGIAVRATTMITTR